MKALSSAQTAILHRTLLGRQLKKEEKDMDQFWRVPDLMVHLEYDLYFKAIHSLLLLRKESIKDILP